MLGILDLILIIDLLIVLVADEEIVRQYNGAIAWIFADVDGEIRRYIFSA